MTIEELRAKLESCDVKSEETVFLPFDRDEARDMALSYNLMRRDLYDYLGRDWPMELTDEVKEAMSNLIKLISDESEMYDSFALRIGQEMVSRLNKKSYSYPNYSRE